MTVQYPSGARGQIAIIVALSLVVLIGFVGLAIDSGRAYGVRARLSAAVDAAAIAAGRALATGDTDADRIASAYAAAQRYYVANYPPGYLGSTQQQPAGVTATHNLVPGDPGYGTWTVTVTGSANMTQTFTSVLGSTAFSSVGASSAAVRRDIDVMLVLDTSGSLGPPTSPSSVFPALKAAAIDHFVSHFAPGANGDRVGLVSFASGAVTDVPIDKTAARGFNQSALTSAINALTVTGSTAQAAGFDQALGELNAIPIQLRSSLRVLVLFSDGAPNDVSATFTRTTGAQVSGDLYSETSIGSGCTPSPCRATNIYYNNNLYRDRLFGTYTDIASLPAQGIDTINLAGYNGKRTLTGTPVTNTRCNVNKAARNMVENVANAARGQGVLVMTVGLGTALTSLEITFCGYGASEQGSNILNRLANTSSSDTRDPNQPQGMYCYALDSGALNDCFDRIADAILRLTM